MGGATLRGVLLSIVCCALSLNTFVLPYNAEAAPAPLEFPRDYVTLDVPEFPGLYHAISFVLPKSSAQIRPEDWIEIEMPFYSNVTVATGVIGSYGNPTFSLVGNRIKISNIAILSGSNVEIIGITATNPVESASRHIVIRVVEETDGIRIVRNESVIIPNTSRDVVNVSAYIESPLSAVDISGYTAPDTFVMLTEDTVALGTVTSDGTGLFRFSLNAIDPREHLFTVTATDDQKRTTSAHTINLFMLPATAYSVTGIVLSPTISLSVESISPGETVTLNGQAPPLSAISIVMQPVVRTYTVTTDAEGFWSHTITAADTNTLIPGVYQLRAQAEHDGILSLFSPTVNLTVQAPDDNNPLPCSYVSNPEREGWGIIFQGETTEREIALTELNSMTSKGDLNCDSKTNLRDFSILLTHWNTNHRRADIIVDGIVNLKDFSRMMFYFQR